MKLGNVMSDVFGISGQEMLEALLSGREREAEEIAGMAKNQLRTKIPQLIATLKGHQMNDHHRWLIQQSIDHIVLLDRQLGLKSVVYEVMVLSARIMRVSCSRVPP